MDESKLLRLRDPILGWRWVIDCSWCGAVGRWKTKSEAQAGLVVHDENAHIFISDGDRA
jgi:hypothetical protein